MALAAFQTHPTLTGIAVPSAGSGYAGRFAITTAPIASGAIGPCVVHGLAACKVNIQTAGDPFADLKASDNTQLESGNAGACQIICNPSGSTGSQWCLVRFATKFPPGLTFYVALTSDGSGSLGSDTTMSSWKYNVKDLNGNSLGTSVSPQVGRTNGTYAAASYGEGYFDLSDNFHLFIAYELPGTAHC